MWGVICGRGQRFVWQALAGARLLKLYGWEADFVTRIGAARVARCEGTGVAEGCACRSATSRGTDPAGALPGVVRGVWRFLGVRAAVGYTCYIWRVLHGGGTARICKMEAGVTSAVREMNSKRHQSLQLWRSSTYFDSP